MYRSITLFSLFGGDLHVFYTNRNFPLITHSSIVEWDIKSGNTSIMREYNLAPVKKIEKLEQMDKSSRVKSVGIMMKQKDFAKSLEEGFNDAVKRFLEINQLTDDDIVSIKRDAIFVKAKEINYPTLGEWIHFIPKQRYTAFLLLSGIEFLLREDRQFDIKGLSDEVIPLHQNGILDFIKEFLTDFDWDAEGLNRYCKQFVEAYKNRSLPFHYYREFNQLSNYHVIDGPVDYRIDEIDESIIDQVDISYNYKTFIIPLLQYLF